MTATSIGMMEMAGPVEAREDLTRIRLLENSTGQGLLLTSLALLALGVVMVHSALASPAAAEVRLYSQTTFRNSIFGIAAALVLLTLWRLDYHWFARGKFLPALPTLLLTIAIVSSVLVFVGFGYSRYDRVRWFRIGPAAWGVGFQPSELMMYALPLFLASWLTRPAVKVRSFFRTFLPALVLIGACAALSITEDFSAGMMTGLAGVIVLLLAGVPVYYLLMILPPMAYVTYHVVTHSREKMARIQAFLDPYDLTNRCAYQARESLLAVLTGGWHGKGLGCGSLKLGYLPERSTDFIFAVICEELGFIGAMLVVGLLLMWMWNARRAALRASDRLGYVLAGGMGILVAFQAIVHIAVTVVAIPPLGMSLPFVSAGGSGLILTAAAVATMVSVTAFRKAETALPDAPC